MAKRSVWLKSSLLIWSKIQSYPFFEKPILYRRYGTWIGSSMVWWYCYYEMVGWSLVKWRYELLLWYIFVHLECFISVEKHVEIPYISLEELMKGQAVFFWVYGNVWYVYRSYYCSIVSHLDSLELFPTTAQLMLHL